MTIIQADVVILGGNVGGIGAAMAAARRGRNTVMIEPSPYIGGLMASGLGMTDIRNLNASGSIFREYASKVLDHYIETYGADSQQVSDCNNGLRFEPSVAKKVFKEMIDSEQHLQVFASYDLVSVEMNGDDLQSITVRALNGGQSMTLQAKVFIDATYEGDLAALAGVPYSLGRESRDEWNEEYAGVLYQIFRTKEILPGSTGEGDDRVQAYNFRLCLTKNPDNQVPFYKPDIYNREDYSSLVQDVLEGRIKTIREVINIVPIPNEKSDTNNHHNCMCSTDLPEENTNYPEGSREERERIIQRHREYIQGLLWFLQHDDQLPEWFRNDAKQWGYAADEFQDTGHFPPQIYVREARRIHGEYVFTENDARLAPGLDRSPIHFDSIACGDYAIDSHATLKRNDIGGNLSLEAFMSISWLTEVYQIPYGVIVPREVNHLLVPVAVSATHMGLGTIRMEPCWMQLGFAAGVAADLSIKTGDNIRQLSKDRLQDELLAENQVIAYLKDVSWGSEESKATQYFTSKGWITSYHANLDEPLLVAQASQWISGSRMLEGGMAIPTLPATESLLPAGVDMGPRNPRQDDPLPREYWENHPYLSRISARRWANVAARALGVQSGEQFFVGEGHVSKGEFLSALYSMLKEARKNL